MSDRPPSGARTIRTDYLARVEGEGAMYVELRDGEVRDVRLRIYEPPRFFEAFLRGRAYTEVPDIVARICGICPIAYQVSGVRAIEDACGVAIDSGPLRDLRRLIYCGEWIESHALHVFFLHAPDFLGHEGFLDLAAARPDLAERALELKRTGNELVAAIGGRAVHPISIRVGGFHRVPAKRELSRMRDPLLRARDLALETVRWTQELDFPDVERQVDLVALHDEAGIYPIDRGRIVATTGLDIRPAEFHAHFVEEHVEHSSALHARLRGGGAYLTGPLARFALGSQWLAAPAAAAARDAGLVGPERNPFRSIVVRAVELVQACEEALTLIEDYEEPDAPALEVVPRAGVGHGVSEAPRGVLYHRYELAEDGTILDARIVPPTSQNQLAIEEDLRAVVARYIDLDDDELTRRCEQAVRNHDPCISCATHFLDLTVHRS
jgi:coenzyme F420-reducing hydrogenase alpha subunit